MATKKKPAKPAKKTVNVKKIAPAKKAAHKPVHSSGNNKTAKKTPAAKSTAKPVAKKVAPLSSAKKHSPVPVKKTASHLSKTGSSHSISKIPAAAVKSHHPVAKPNPVAKPHPMAKPHLAAKSNPAVKHHPAANTVSKSQPGVVKGQPVAKPQPAHSTATPVKPVTPVVKPFIATPPPPPPVAVKPEPKKPAAPPKQVKVVIPEIKTKTVRKYEPEFTKSVLDTPQEEQTGPTMRYSDAELGEFRELINRKLDAAKKELAYLQGLITRKDEMGGDNDDARYMTMEDGSMSMEREQLSQMASRQITFIDHLEKALMRIENKTYGICRVTGKLIDKARLRAVPHATLSIEAKQMMNK